MKKQFLKYTLTAALVAGCILPQTTMAQKGLGEIYGRPSYWNPYDQRGINRFETSKLPDSIPFEGPRVRFGAGFTQQFQNIKHSNTALNNGGNTPATAGANKLYPLTPGFMTAQANLFIDVQLADGIRLNVTNYMSSRHHNEFWVKGGYIQFDKLPFKGKFWNDLMEITTIKVGHMEVNYGDAHFRRPDAGHTLQSPFMEGNIADAFATEIGGEVYVQKNGLFGMFGMTNGMIKGHVDSTTPGMLGTEVVDPVTKRNPSFILKGGYDKTFAPRVRARISGSLYHNSSQNGSGLTLYSGDRAGSNYQNVMETWASGGAAKAYTAMYTSGRFNPGFSKKMTAMMLNAFGKYQGLEFFGTFETANGRSKTERDDRNMTQLAGELIYRFGKDENLYVGGRYNTVSARLNGYTENVKIDRTSLAAGWFVTKNVLMKAEYVMQNYNNFKNTDFRNGAKFNGYVIEAVVGF
ncbi:hypothetical protein [Aridibaculum aurantiacum]|uniref:hypothetical protein n=1 Tax=Aridibaculum aurantiacum TaxID=2810307 RepID=UPI001A9701A1|nr:hypothetical protein [Aridibaculum aurantiacum]